MRERALGKNNSQFGKTPWNANQTKDTNESLFKASETFKMNYKKENHPFFGKERPDSVKNAISQYQKNRPKSESQKSKISNSLKGRRLSDETKQKMSEARKGKEQKTGTCPHCLKVFSLPTLSRWHNENCKEK